MVRNPRRFGRRQVRLVVAAAIALIVAVVGLIATRAARPQIATHTFRPAAAAWLDLGTGAHGPNGSGRLRVDGSPDVRSYLRFMVGGLSGKVVRATLRLQPTSASRAGITVYGSGAQPWTPVSLGTGAAPLASGVLGSTGPTTPRRSATVGVARAVHGDGAVTFVLASSSPTATSFAGAGMPGGPELVVSTRGSGRPQIVPTPPVEAAQPTFPIRAAWYVPWSAAVWRHRDVRDLPVLGRYDSTDATVAREHVAMMRYAGIDTGVVAWRGRSTTAGRALPVLLRAAHGTTVKWAVAYTGSHAGTDLRELLATAAKDDSYLKVDGRPVVFVPAGRDACGMAASWRRLGVEGVVAATTRCTGTDAVAVSGPLRGSGAFTRAVRTMAAMHAHWQLLNSWNDWAHGTPMEPSTAWESGSGEGRYLDILHRELAPQAPNVTGIGAGADPYVVAAGDIACTPGTGSWNGGAGTARDCHELAVSDLFVDAPVRPAAVLPLGDIQYECGDANGFRDSFGPSWGRLKELMRPVVGNHDYGGPCGRDAAGPYFGYFGREAGNGQHGWYSYDIGSWHLIALNSECRSGKGAAAVGGCGPGSPQESWLHRDLAAHTNQCVLAYWHEPRYSSGEHGDAQQMAVIWNDLAEAHVAVVLAGHNHDYERFAPAGPAPPGAAYQAPTLAPAGVREFVVGTGGKNHYAFRRPPLAGEQVRNDDTYGVLQLGLHDGWYDWRFVAEPGKTFTDSGRAGCPGS